MTNLEAGTDTAPFFERAVHYNRLSPGSVERLERLARQVHAEALARINAEAAALQQTDADSPDATLRFRSCAYVLTEEDPE